jgi:AGZA family xanthine/uracil permease-like MFS transporter
MPRALDSFFKLASSGTNVRTELLAGLTTFLTMSYIIFVQPAVLSTDFAGNPTGLDFGAVLLATCLVSAAACIFMGLFARYPIALAPGMGENFFFVSVIMSLTALGVANAWQVALGIVLIAGLVFLVLSLLPFREILITAIGPSMRSGIAVGIGLFIAFIGLRNGGLVVAHPGTLVSLTPHLLSPDVAVFLVGLLVAATLQATRVKGSLVLGILASTILAAILGKISLGTVVGLPEIDTHAAFRFDVRGALTLTCLPFIIVFVVMDVLDTTGTLVGVAEQAGFMKEGKLPRAPRVLVVDAAGTVAGACLGTSTVTSYIESTTGIAAGGRTGLTSITTGLLFLLALLFGPAIGAIANYPPITAPALVIVGTLMLSSALRIDWPDPTEAVPAFLVMVGIPLTYSIADGLALGFVTYPLIKLMAGRGRQVHPLMYVMAVVLLAYFVFVRTRLG